MKPWEKSLPQSCPSTYTIELIFLAWNDISSFSRPLIRRNSVHFKKCGVTVWEDQVRLFKAASQLSPQHRIDIVIANAGRVTRRIFLADATRNMDAH